MKNQEKIDNNYTYYQNIFKDLIQDYRENNMRIEPFIESDAHAKKLYFDQVEKESLTWKCPEDAVFYLLEQLYNSKNAINEQAIDSCALYLSRTLDLDYEEEIKEGLCVEHYMQKKRSRGADIDFFKWFSEYTLHLSKEGNNG